LTSDENTNIFFAGSDVIVAFLRGDWAGTYWHFYPGVTMSWLDALGMGGQYLWEWLAGRSLPPFTDYIYGDILGLVVANRLPYAFLTAAAVPLLYLLARQLLPEPVALLGSLFLAFDPFFLAHSRVAHGDAPVAVFMAISALSLLIYVEQLLTLPMTSPLALLRHSSRVYLVISAIAGGLAALTKAPGQFMALFTIGLAGFYAFWEWKQARRAQEPALPTIRALGVKWIGVVGLWGLISLAVFILLWPAMWVEPLETIGRMWSLCASI
jgi:dolichyl-phosphate-mannose--protein O-mannosyl transferase